jgi:hypothetical protein
MWKSRESGKFCLIPDFRRNDFSFFRFSMMPAIVLSHIAFIMLGNVFSMPTFFYYEKMFNFVEGFFCIYWYDDMGFVLDSVLCVLICECCSILASLELNLLIMVYDLFNVLLDSASKYFIEDFWVYVHQGPWPITFFFLMFLCLALVLV